jgi:hypothetical protein
MELYDIAHGSVKPLIVGELGGRDPQILEWGLHFSDKK